MAVIVPTRNDVPVHMRNNIAEAGQIDLVRIEERTQSAFNAENSTHQPLLLGHIQVRHFGDMTLENYSAKARIVSIGHANDATEIISPKQIASGRAAQIARLGGRRKIAHELIKLRLL